jgi:uncharacterized membrane protein
MTMPSTALTKTTVEGVVAKTALFGVVGWALENALFKERYSALFQGRHVPFLPVYAAGGLAVMAAAPHLARCAMITRGAIYAALGTAVEYAGCQIDRKLYEGRAWDYGKSDVLAINTDGCLDWKHSALWGALGLIAEKLSQP